MAYVYISWLIGSRPFGGEYRVCEHNNNNICTAKFDVIKTSDYNNYEPSIDRIAIRRVLCRIIILFDDDNNIIS